MRSHINIGPGGVAIASFQIGTPAVRWRNFRGFEDTDWIELAPLTVILGENNSGKSSLLAPLLVMKQSLASKGSAPLLTNGPLASVGHFRDFVHDHVASSSVFFGIRFHHHDDDEQDEHGDHPDYGPGEVTVEFGLSGEDHIELRSYEVGDVYGRPVIRRERQSDGSFSTDFEGLQNSERQTPVGKAVLAARPDRFLFDGRGLRTWFADQFVQAEGTATEPDFPEVPHEVLHYIAIVETAKQTIERVLSRFDYLGPVREPFPRVIDLDDSPPTRTGPRGENTLAMIANAQEAERERVSAWARRFGIASAIKVERLAEAVRVGKIQPGEDTIWVNIADTGFGVSQLLPVVAQLELTPNRRSLIAEQPEIHLNPRQQTVLSDLFAEAARKERSVVVETHSEHLLLRLRRLVSEDAVNVDDFALYFVERNASDSRVRRINVQQNGHIEREEWPPGFFDASISEAVGLAASQARRKRSG